MIVSKAYTRFLYHPMLFVEHVCDCFQQIAEYELLRWPWYRTPVGLLQYEKVE